MKSLCAVQNSGLGAYTVQPMPDDFQDTQAWYDMDYERRRLAAARDEAQAWYNQGTQAAVDAANTPAPAPAQTAADILEESRRFQFLARTRPGFDYGARSSERNSLFARDSGLGFDLMNAIASSLKTNAPQAFKGVKGSEVVRSILPNAGGPSAPKVTLPSWLPKISLPRPLQDAAKRAQALAIATAKDVAAKKRAADAANSGGGVASQTSDYPGESSSGSLLWIGGGAAVLAAAFIMTRKK